MSNFLSQLEFNPQVDENDDDDFEKEDVEREKEIKELLANELNDDEFFQDDCSLISHQTSGNAFDSQMDSYNQFYDFQYENDNRPTTSVAGPLLTSRGSDFLNGTSPRAVSDEFSNKKGDSSQENYSKMEQQNNFADSNQYCGQKVSPVVQDYEKNDNWRNLTADENGSYHYSYDDRPESGMSGCLNKKEDHQFDKDYDQGTSMPDSFYTHFNANNIHGIHNNGSYDSDKINSLDLSNVQQYSEDYILKFPNKSEVQAMVDASFEEHANNGLDLNDNQFGFQDYKQLKILYDVRGKKIEELQLTLENSREKQATELRVMQHKLALMTGERDGISTSLKQSQELISEEREKVNQLQKKLFEEQNRSERLKNEKNELCEKLDVSESTIESLNQQLTSLNHAESLSRLRSQHEVLMGTLRQKHEEEILRLKEKLDDIRKELNWKIEDVNRLQDEVQTAKKSANQIKIQSAETINSLSKSLEQSQRQLREILEEGKLGEAGEAKSLLKQAVSDKGQLELENRELKEEVKDMKEQLGMYELVIDSATSGPSSSTPFTEQNFDKRPSRFGAFKTPLSRFERHGSLVDSPVYSIRDELVKALANNKAKREELKEAKKKIDLLQAELEEIKKENQRHEKNVKNFKAGDESDKVEKAANLLRNEEFVTDMQLQIKEAKEKTEQLEIENMHLKTENVNLKSEISQMIQDFDRSKIEALKNCEKTYTQFNEDIKRSLEEKLKEEHEHELEFLRNEMDSLKHELFDVKESYVTLADENKTLENHIRLECKQELEQRLIELKNVLNEAKKEELRLQEEELLNQHFAKLEEEKKRIKESLDEESKHKVETAIALAKVEWFAAYEFEKTSAIDNAVENAKLKIIRAKDSEMQQLTSKMKEDFEYEKQLAKSEWEKAARVESEKKIGEALNLDEIKTQNDERETMIKIILNELGTDLDAGDKSAALKKIQSLKQEVDVNKENLKLLKHESDSKENGLLSQMNEMKSRHIEETKNAVNKAKAEWAKERGELMQEILKEESQRIRKEVMLDFTEDDGPKEQVETWIKTGNDEDVYSEFRGFIQYMQSVYSKKFKALKRKRDDQIEVWKKEQDEQLEKQIKENRESLDKKMNIEKQIAIKDLNENWTKYLEDSKAKQEDVYKEHLNIELEAAKFGWKRELEELQREHESVLRETVKEMKSQNEAEQAGLKRKFNEYLRKIKRDFTEKSEKQKSEVEKYHTDLTKKTVQLAKKEWELQLTNRDGLARRSGKRSHSQSAVSTPTLMQEKTQEHIVGLRLNSSDSGFASPKLQSHLSTPKILDDQMTVGKVVEETTIGTVNSSRQRNLKNHISVQTENEEENALTLQNMRRYYLETVNGIKEDVFKHVRKTKENASFCFRKQVAKEKKLLLEKIRRKFLKILNANDENGFGKETEEVILQVLKDADVEEECSLQLADSKEKNGKANSLTCINDEKTTFVSKAEANMEKSSKMVGKENSAIEKDPKTKLLSKMIPSKSLKVNQPSPNNSMFSCDSNGTFYTDLPSTFVVTPFQEERALPPFQEELTIPSYQQENNGYQRH